MILHPLLNARILSFNLRLVAEHCSIGTSGVTLSGVINSKYLSLKPLATGFQTTTQEDPAAKLLNDYFGLVLNKKPY
jgi:hypothetical protein